MKLEATLSPVIFESLAPGSFGYPRPFLAVLVCGQRFLLSSLPVCDIGDNLGQKNRHDCNKKCVPPSKAAHAPTLPTKSSSRGRRERLDRRVTHD